MTQYKILKEALPVYCSEKLYLGVGKIVCNTEDWDQTTFCPNPPDEATKRKLSMPYRTQLCVERVDTEITHPTSGEVTIVTTDVPCIGTKWVVFDKNKQKIVMGK